MQINLNQVNPVKGDQNECHGHVGQQFETIIRKKYVPSFLARDVVHHKQEP